MAGTSEAAGGRAGALAALPGRLVGLRADHRVETDTEYDDLGAAYTVEYCACGADWPCSEAALLVGYDALLARVAALEGALRDVVGNEWAGWGWDDIEGRWECFYCAARGGVDEAEPPSHRERCALAQARAVLAGGGDAPCRS